MSIRAALLASACVLAFAVPARAAELPEAIRKAGALRLSVNAIYPPMEYKDPATGKLQGVDIDLGEAIAAKLGLTVTWQESAFEQLIPSLQTGRTDFILSGLSDLPARRDSMDFVDYMRSGAQFYVLASSPVQAQPDLCGKRVGSSRSTSFPAEIKRWSDTSCEAAGRPAIQVVAAESTADARAQLKQGRIDAAVQGMETIPYITGLEPGTFRPVGPAISVNYQGMAFRKTDTALRDVVADTFAALVADGTYGRIMAKWGLSATALDGVMLNGERRP